MHRTDLPLCVKLPAEPKLLSLKLRYLQFAKLGEPVVDHQCPLPVMSLKCDRGPPDVSPILPPGRPVKPDSFVAPVFGVSHSPVPAGIVPVAFIFPPAVLAPPS